MKILCSLLLLPLIALSTSVFADTADGTPGVNINAINDNDPQILEAAKSVAVMHAYNENGDAYPYCTAFLVDHNLVATAGHCLSALETGFVQNNKLKQTVHFTFNWRDTQFGHPKNTKHDIYVAKRIVKNFYTGKDNNMRINDHDYALIQLDRFVEGTKPLKLLESTPKCKDAAERPLLIIGHPDRKPLHMKTLDLKCEDNTDMNAMWSVSNLFRKGHSGSPVFTLQNNSLKVIGIASYQSKSLYGSDHGDTFSAFSLLKGIKDCLGDADCKNRTNKNYGHISNILDVLENIQTRLNYKSFNPHQLSAILKDLLDTHCPDDILKAIQKAPRFLEIKNDFSTLKHLVDLDIEIKQNLGEIVAALAFLQEDKSMPILESVQDALTVNHLILYATKHFETMNKRINATDPEQTYALMETYIGKRRPEFANFNADLQSLLKDVFAKTDQNAADLRKRTHQFVLNLMPQYGVELDAFVQELYEGMFAIPYSENKNAFDWLTEDEKKQIQEILMATDAGISANQRANTLK